MSVRLDTSIKNTHILVIFSPYDFNSLTGTHHTIRLLVCRVSFSYIICINAYDVPQHCMGQCLRW